MIVSIVLISLFVIGAVSASDDVAPDVTAVSDDNEIQAIDEVDELQTSDDTEEVLSDFPVEPQMNITAKEAKYDEDASIEISVVDKNNPETSFNNTNVSIFVDDTFVKNLTFNESGKASYIIPAGTYNVGTYHIVAAMTGAFNQTLLKISKADPVVNVENVEAVTKTIIKIPFNVTDKKGKGIDGDVIVTIHWENDVISKYVKVKDGKADVQFDISDLIGIFNGNSTGFNISALFGNSSNRTSFNISALFGENGTFNITGLFGENATFNISSLLGGNGTFNITAFGNGTFNFSSLTNGTFNFTNMFNFNKSLKFAYVLDVGTYNLTVTYLPSWNYNEATNDTAKLIITYDEDVVYSCDITTPEKFGDKTTAAIALVDKYGIPITNGTVIIVLNGIDVGNVTLDKNGTALITFDNLTNGDYELLLDYNGTNKTFKFSVAVPMKVVINCSDIAISAVNTKIGEMGGYLSLTLIDEAGNLLANKTVLIAIDGKINNVTTDSNGVAKLQLNISKAGIYTASICFLGDDLYSSSFNITKVTVKKQTAKLKTKKFKYKAKAKTKKLKASFKSAKGIAISGKKISFTVNGKTYAAKTNAKGVATVKVKVTKKGTYKFAAKFAGDDTYNAVSKKAKLVIK